MQGFHLPAFQNSENFAVFLMQENTLKRYFARIGVFFKRTGGSPTEPLAFEISRAGDMISIFTIDML